MKPVRNDKLKRKFHTDLLVHIIKMNRSKLFENATELIDPETVVVEGKALPSYVNGVILRNGPAKFDLSETFTMNNFYDGYSMLTRFEVNEGKVTLKKKYLDSESHRKAMAAGKPCTIEFCTRSYADPEKSILFRHLPDVSKIKLKPNLKINLFK